MKRNRKLICITFYNKKYNEKLIRESNAIHFDQVYIDDFFRKIKYKNNVVIFDFAVEYLKNKYQRIKSLGTEKSQK